MLPRTMPLPKRPYVASADEVRITRDGDNAIIEYADEKVSITLLKVGAARLAAMTDEELLDFWNEGVQANEDHRQSYSYTAIEIPVGNPQSSSSNEATSGRHGVMCFGARFYRTQRSRLTWMNASCPLMVATSPWANS